MSRGHGITVSQVQVSTIVMAEAEDVPLGKGPPTREELLVYYPAKFSWHQLKTFINSGWDPTNFTQNYSFYILSSDLGLLKRDKALQIRYDLWLVGVKKQYGTIGEAI